MVQRLERRAVPRERTPTDAVAYGFSGCAARKGGVRSAAQRHTLETLVEIPASYEMPPQHRLRLTSNVRIMRIFRHQLGLVRHMDAERKFRQDKSYTT